MNPFFEIKELDGVEVFTLDMELKYSIGSGAKVYTLDMELKYSIGYGAKVFHWIWS